MTATLRGFALAVYAADGVDRACLLLQGRLGLDVNLLLFAAYVGVARGRVPTCAVLGAARVGAWHQEVVRPLRMEIVVQATGHRHTTDDERDALTTIALAAARQIGRIP